MKILLLSQQLNTFRSGVGTYAYSLASGLAGRGHDVTVVVPGGEVAEINRVKIIPVRRPRFDPTPGGWIALGRSFAEVLGREAANHDIAHFTDARESWTFSSPKLPLTGMANDSYALDWIEDWYPRKTFADRSSRSLYYRFLRWAEPRTYRQLSVLLCNSEHVARAVTTGYRLEPSRVSVVHYGLVEPPPVPTVPIEGEPSILFVGGNFQRKGLPQLLMAGAALKDRLPNLRIHVVGKDRNQPAMESLAAELGLAERVDFHGWQPNERVRGMMAGAHIFALPSITEGFGLVYLEAMRAGIPVVATAVGGASEVFQDGLEALFVRPDDTKGLSDTILRLTVDKELRCQLVEGGRKAAGRFSVERMTDETEKIFAGVLA